MPPYKKTTLAEMDPYDKNLGTKITQQILMQGEHMGAVDFFKPPEKLSNKKI